MRSADQWERRVRRDLEVPTFPERPPAHVELTPEEKERALAGLAQARAALHNARKVDA